MYCEGKVSEEIIRNEDGTSRQGIGEMATCTAKIEGKIRVLKTIKYPREIAKTGHMQLYVYMLKRLATASNSEIDTIWQKVYAILTPCAK